jgi:Undecaprenyl-phosphate glucose phosphotransferase
VTDIDGRVRNTGRNNSFSWFRYQDEGATSLESSTATKLGVPAAYAPVGAKKALKHSVSNEQASSNLSLFITAIVVLTTSVITGRLYLFASGRDYTDLTALSGTGVLIAVFFCATVRLTEGRQPLKTSHVYGRARSASLAWLTSIALFLAITFTFKFGAELSRGATISFFAVGLVTAVISHMNVPKLLNVWRPSFIQRDIILISAYDDPTAQTLAAEFSGGGVRGLYQVEFNAACGAMEWSHERRRLLDRVLALAHRLGPGEIYLAISKIPSDRSESILRALTLVPRAVSVVPDVFTAQLLRHSLSQVAHEIAIDVQKAPMSGAGHALKRTVDILLSCLLIVFIAPLFLVIAIAVRLDSAGPVLFRQTRNGYQGRNFRILKFRTMTVMEDGAVINQAQKNDPRTTRVGRWLRKTSLDELPQLFNVLRGEMSLIGPRPHARAHDEYYRKLIDNYEIRQHVKPGITGWAQVNGLRGETQNLDLMHRRVEFDVWYARHCSSLLDLRILALTILEVLRTRNAF